MGRLGLEIHPGAATRGMVLGDLHLSLEPSDICVLNAECSFPTVVLEQALSLCISWSLVRPWVKEANIATQNGFSFFFLSSSFSFLFLFVPLFQ